MKKKWITAVLCLSVLTTMTGTFVKADDTVQEESILEKYEHQHREVGEAVYRKAASAFSGGDGSESAPYEISSAEELQYLANLLAEDALSDYRGKHYILTMFLIIKTGGKRGRPMTGSQSEQKQPLPVSSMETGM